MTRILVFDFRDLKEFFGTTEASDHNLYVRGRYVYEANYKAGLRILDGADPLNPQEVGYFDRRLVARTMRNTVAPAVRTVLS